LIHQATSAKSINNETDQSLLGNWGVIYNACHMRELAYTLERFLENPWMALNAAGQGDALKSIDAGYEPLLPAQAGIAVRLQESDTAITTNDSPTRTTTDSEGT